MIPFDPQFAAAWWRLVRQGPGCWEWQGIRDKAGYGVFWYLGRRYRAHRVAYVLQTGRQPTRQCLHQCDNPACQRVGPGHVYEGTHAENMRDMADHGRASNQHVGKLTCGRGHPWTSANTLWRFGPNGKPLRECRLCKATRKAKRRQWGIPRHRA